MAVVLQVMRLWETIWARDMIRKLRQEESSSDLRNTECCSSSSSSHEIQTHRQPSMLTFVVAAAVLQQRRAIFRECGSADDVLALFSTQKVRLEQAVSQAYKLMTRQ